MDACNALTKVGSASYVCELPLHHHGPHQWQGAGTVSLTWSDDWDSFRPSSGG